MQTRFGRPGFDRQAQAARCADGIDAYPSWPAGAVTAAELRAKAAEAEERYLDAHRAENALRDARFVARQVQEELLELIRKVDSTTTGLFGYNSPEKLAFGVRPIDTERNSQGPVRQVLHVRLADGREPATMEVRWKAVRRATYSVEWCADEPCTHILGHATALRTRYAIHGVPPGTQLWVRVRALRGRHEGDWSEPVTRIVNV